MTDSVCTYHGDRDEALVGYLYDEGGDRAGRAAFQAHLARCARCTADLAALHGVRVQLAHWAPPEPKFGGARDASSEARFEAAAPRAWWREIPVWAQVAAALLVLGVSAAIANFDVRYDANGLSIRTGWSKPAAGPAAVPAATPSAPVGTNSQNYAPWRGDLDALERQLKNEFHTAQTAAPIAPAAAPRPSADAETLRRVRALIDDSEKRQQRELALRLGEAIRDVNAQRQADLVRVDRALGTVQNRLGVQVLKNAQQVQQMDYLIRASQRQ